MFVSTFKSWLKSKNKKRSFYVESTRLSARMSNVTRQKMGPILERKRNQHRVAERTKNTHFISSTNFCYVSLF